MLLVSTMNWNFTRNPELDLADGLQQWIFRWGILERMVHLLSSLFKYIFFKANKRHELHSEYIFFRPLYLSESSSVTILPMLSPVDPSRLKLKRTQTVTSSKIASSSFPESAYAIFAPPLGSGSPSGQLLNRTFTLRQCLASKTKHKGDIRHLFISLTQATYWRSSLVPAHCCCLRIFQPEFLHSRDCIGRREIKASRPIVTRFSASQ